jgi:hypothetical protein
MLLIRGNNSATSAARAKARADCVCFPRRPRRRAREVAREQCQLACVMPPDLRVRCAPAAFAARLRAITCAGSQSARPGEQQRRTRADVGPRPPMSQDLPLYGVTSCRRSHDIVRALATTPMVGRALLSLAVSRWRNGRRGCHHISARRSSVYVGLAYAAKPCSCVL